MNNVAKLMIISALVSSLSGCFLTKIATMPMRVVGASASLVGAVVSVVPVAGNKVDEALETADEAIDTAADTVDDIPL
ncbi:MAG: hypothetical protein H6996_00190 [Moraxellaceae bacterium]|nr:hypothetical protein [Moraxellaceae bacterium]